MWKNSLKIKLIVSFALISFVAIGVIGASSIASMKKTVEQEIQNKLLLLADAKEGQIYAYLDSLEARTKDFSSDGLIINNVKGIASGSSQSVVTLNEHLIKDKKPLDLELIDIDVLNKNGVVIASTNPKEIGRDKKDDLCFIEGKKAIATINPEKGEYPDRNSAILEVAAPLIDPNTGEFLGVIVNAYSTDKLSSILSGEFQIQKGALSTGQTFVQSLEVHLIDKNKNTLAHGHKESGQQADRNDTLPVTECLNSQKEIIDIYTNYAGKEVIGASMCFPQRGWALLTEISTQEAFAAVREATYSMVIMMALTLLFVILDIFVIAGNIIKPVKKLQEATGILAKGNLDYQVDINTHDELEQLAGSFNMMALDLKKSHLEVQQYSKGLEEKVAEQTKKLTDKMVDLENSKLATLNILEDVDEEKKRVQSEKDRIDAILHSIGDGVFVIDINLKIILINDVALGMCGYDEKSTIGKKYSDVLHFVYEDKPEVVNDSFIQNAIKTGLVQEMTNHTLLMRADGTKISVADSCAPLKDITGKVIGCVVVFRDVTKERQIDRMKTEFISLASHQLRTPLSAIKWFAELLQSKDSGVLNKEQAEFASNIAISTERMIDLVNSLLNVSRIESGRIIIDPQPTDLGVLVKEVIKELQNKIDEKKINLAISVHEALPKISIDPKLIREVYANLLTNAVKYTPEGGDITIMISKKDADIISQVSDSGVGVPAKDKNRVFQKFYRGENVVKLEPNGNGLGLYLVKSIIESSKGKIWFDSTEGKGTTFWFSLPLSGTPAKAGEVTIDS